MVSPQTVKGVKKSKEIEVDQVTVQERLEQKPFETQDSYELKKEQQHEAEQLAIEEREEQNKINLPI